MHARKCAEWLRAVAVRDGEALAWRAVPESSAPPRADLYYGTAGVVLFFLELHKATGDEGDRDTAGRGARWLLAQAKEEGGGLHWLVPDDNGKPVADAGLYTGASGIGAAFLELHRHLGGEEYRRAALGAATWVASRPVEAWTVYDIIGGAAGAALFLVRASRELGAPRLLEAAARLGDHLIAVATREKEGLRWRMSATWNRLYPNFSHGTSGVAYALAAIYAATKEERFLAAAKQGAEWLAARRAKSDAGAVWHRHEPDATELYYVGWCHGPAGTARLFRQLHRATGEPAWDRWVGDCARWVMGCGAPEKALPGFWNVSQCCGSAGVGDFLADLYLATRDESYRRRAGAYVDDLLRRAAPGDPGLKWIQAENRVSPKEVFAQTGYAQGAAGIGIFFLKMHAADGGMPGRRPLVLPDSPFNE
jgi:lantibiotic modifying enzyme